MAVEDLLINILKETGFDVIRQGSMAAEDEYPDDFFTFWNNSSFCTSFYDNENTSGIADFDVNFYSNNPQNTYDILQEMTKTLRAQGFIIADSGHDVMSDVETHTGRGINVLFMNL